MTASLDERRWHRRGRAIEIVAKHSHARPWVTRRMRSREPAHPQTRKRRIHGGRAGVQSRPFAYAYAAVARGLDGQPGSVRTASEMQPVVSPRARWEDECARGYAQSRANEGRPQRMPVLRGKQETVWHHRRPRQLPARPSDHRQGGEAPQLTARLKALLVGRFVATSGEKRRPPVGKFVAAVGENPMAIDSEAGLPESRPN